MWVYTAWRITFNIKHKNPKKSEKNRFFGVFSDGKTGDSTDTTCKNFQQTTYFKVVKTVKNPKKHPLRTPIFPADPQKEFRAYFVKFLIWLILGIIYPLQDVVFRSSGRGYRQGGA